MRSSSILLLSLPRAWFQAAPHMLGLSSFLTPKAMKTCSPYHTSASNGTASHTCPAWTGLKGTGWVACSSKCGSMAAARTGRSLCGEKASPCFGRGQQRYASTRADRSQATRFSQGIDPHAGVLHAGDTDVHVVWSFTGKVIWGGYILRLSVFPTVLHTMLDTMKHICTHTHTRTHTHTHIHTRARTHTCTHTYTHMHAHTHIHTCTHTHVHTHIHTHIYTHAHTHIHTCMHTHVHTHTHTHTPTFKSQVRKSAELWQQLRDRCLSPEEHAELGQGHALTATPGAHQHMNEQQRHQEQQQLRQEQRQEQQQQHQLQDASWSHHDERLLARAVTRNSVAAVLNGARAGDVCASLVAVCSYIDVYLLSVHCCKLCVLVSCACGTRVYV